MCKVSTARWKVRRADSRNTQSRQNSPRCAERVKRQVLLGLAAIAHARLVEMEMLSQGTYGGLERGIGGLGLGAGEYVAVKEPHDLIEKQGLHTPEQVYGRGRKRRGGEPLHLRLDNA